MADLAIDNLLRHSEHRFREIHVQAVALSLVEKFEQRSRLTVVVIAISVIVTIGGT